MIVDPHPSPLMEATEHNLHEHVAFAQRRLPGMWVEHGPDLLIVDSGLPTDTFNKVARARFLEENADLRIESALAHFRAAARPFAWWIGPCSRPYDLERRLESFGLEAAEFELGMAADLVRLPTHFEMPNGLAVRRVTNEGELQDFADVNARNWIRPMARSSSSSAEPPLCCWASTAPCSFSSAT